MIKPQVHRFHDRNQYFRYLLAMETCRRLLAKPSLVEHGRHYLETVMAGDTQIRPSYGLWNELLNEPVEEIVRRWLDDTPEGDSLRASAPIFEVIEGEARRRISAEASNWRG